MSKHEELAQKIRELTEKNSPHYTQIWLSRDTLNELKSEAVTTQLDHLREDVDVLFFSDGKKIKYTKGGKFCSEQGYAFWVLVEVEEYKSEMYPNYRETIPEIL